MTRVREFCSAFFPIGVAMFLSFASVVLLSAIVPIAPSRSQGDRFVRVTVQDGRDVKKVMEIMSFLVNMVSMDAKLMHAQANGKTVSCRIDQIGLSEENTRKFESCRTITDLLDLVGQPKFYYSCLGLSKSTEHLTKHNNWSNENLCLMLSSSDVSSTGCVILRNKGKSGWQYTQLMLHESSNEQESVQYLMQLRNGMVGYCVTDHAGVLYDYVDPKVGIDQKTASLDKRMMVPYSCVGCHAESGPIVPDDGKVVFGHKYNGLLEDSSAYRGNIGDLPSTHMVMKAIDEYRSNNVGSGGRTNER